jgi:hypothetical protein
MPPSASIAGVQIFFGTRSMASRSFSVIANPTEYSTLRPRIWPCSVSQSSRPWEAPAPSERISSVRRWAPGIWAIASVSTSMWSLVAGGVRTGVPGAELAGEELAGVVAPHPDRVIAEGPLERRSRVLLLTVRDHDRGVDVEHHEIGQIGPGNLGRRESVGQLGPHVTPDPGAGGRDLLQPASGDLIQRAPHRRRRGDRTEHPGLVAQHVDVGDRLTTIGEHHRHVDQDPATVVTRREVATGHRLGQLSRQPGPIGQEPGHDAARVGHHADTISGHGQTRRSRSTLHLRSAFQLGNLTFDKSKNPKQDRHFRASTRRSSRRAVNDPG